MAQARADAAQAIEDERAARKQANEDFAAAELDALGVTEEEYRKAGLRLISIKGQQYSDLLAEADEFYDGDITLLVAHNERKRLADIAAADEALEIAEDKADKLAQEEKDAAERAEEKEERDAERAAEESRAG